MANSKAKLVHDMLERSVFAAIADAALNSPEDAAVLKRHCRAIMNNAALAIAYDRYRMRQLQDIMSWKPGPKLP